MTTRPLPLGESSDGEVQRYTVSERLWHWLGGLSFTYCALTGLALFSPYLYWLAAVFGGGPTVRFWHPWLGLVFLAAVLWMHGQWRDDLKLTEADRQWREKIDAYVTNHDQELPPQARFNAGQKLFYWAMFYALLVLLLSGIVMWFPERVPRNLIVILPVVGILHEAAALISIGAIIIHIYMGIFAEPESLRAMISGRVSRAWARNYHRLWYDKVQGQRRSSP
jgi:formate dehydrogenase subunit gamma